MISCVCFTDFSTLSLNRLFTDPWKHCKDAQGRQGRMEVQLFSEDHRKFSALYDVKYSRSSTDQLCQCCSVVPPAEIKLVSYYPCVFASHSSQGRLVSDIF